MSDREIMSGTHDCGADAAAYVLGALEPGEAEAFRAHVQECAVCREEVDTLRAVVHALPMSTPQYAAPRGLRRRVMRQLLDEQPAAGATARRGWSIGRARNRLVAGVAAAMVAAAGVVTAIELAAGTAATVVQAQVDGISGSAQVRITGGRAELVVHNLTPPARGHIYEVWLKSGTAAPVPASVLFGVNSSGNADVGIPGPVRGVSAVLVTPEPYNGTLEPTHTPVIVARLS